MNKNTKTMIVIPAFFLLWLTVFFHAEQMPPDRLLMSTRADADTGLRISEGVYHVYENRVEQRGKILALEFIILHSPAEKPLSPLFVLAGGPGVSATTYAPAMKYNPVLNQQDIVMVGLRGTGGNNRLHCPLSSGDELQGYLDSVFRLPMLRVCLEKLQKEYDLTQYSTPNAVDDLEEIRQALGYRKISLVGFSGGTRVALVYMKRHPRSIRSAILNGVVPFSFKNPLYHASAAQASLNKVFEDCRNDSRCRSAYPEVEKKFQQILARLEKEPAEVTIPHPESGEPVKIRLDRDDFAEAVRFMLYRLQSNRRLPYLINRAYTGDYRPFAVLAVHNARQLEQILSMGLLLCVTCAEDVDRITEAEIQRETRNTFLGDVRVREQKAACAIWPRSSLSPDYADPVTADIPVLMLSGTHDPVTPPRLSRALAEQLPRVLHLVVPGTHGVGGDCLTRIQMAFLKNPDVKQIDTSCAEQIGLPPFFIPDKE